MNRLFSRLPSLTTFLWILASLVAFGAFLYIAPNLLNPPTALATPTSFAVGVPTRTSTTTIPRTATPVALAPAPQQVTREPQPTAPPGGIIYTSVADPTRSGYLKTTEEKPHWGDRNLHAGYFANDRYSSILFFDISALAPNSEIFSAELELSGLSRDNLGPQGEWRATLVRTKPFTEWEDLNAQDFLTATVTTSIGLPLSPTDLDLGRVNEFRFTQDQLPGLTNEIDERPYLIVRLEGPDGPSNSLFTWDGGGLDLEAGVHPTLRIVAHPGEFVKITNTPTAENVVTAAALAVRQTDFATRVGTVTPFPRTYATATSVIHVTREPTAENVETRIKIAQVATAVAITTGTYTPTPENWIVVTATFTPLPTRTPQQIAVATLYARLTALPTQVNTPTTEQLISIPLPDFLKGNILARTDRFGEETLIVMRPDGTLLQGLTGETFYIAAYAREPFSPDRRRRAIVAEDASGILQIWILDVATGNKKPITPFTKGVSYDPVWAPDDSAIAFVSTETGGDEIYLYNLGTEEISKLTNSAGLGQPFNKRPSWSADSSQIAFRSSRSGNDQIWIMNADGSNLHNVSQSTFNDYDPIWVK